MGVIYTTEKLLEDFTTLGYDAYKYNSRGSLTARKLNRKETVTIDGIEFNCWKEYIYYKVGEQIQNWLPDADVEVNLDGNDTQITASFTDEERRELTSKLYVFIEKVKQHGKRCVI